MTKIEIALVMIFGAMGSLCRFGAGRAAKVYLPAALPFGTMLVNITGCFLFGLIMQVSLSGDFISKDLRTAATTGFLGAFTTFSTFGYETFDLLRQGHWLQAGANASLNLLLGLLAVWAGVTLARLAVS